jgi:pimeloyl-ACP methyl ester carboxylesterase
MRRHGFLGIVMPPGSVVDPVRTAAELGTLFGHDLGDQQPVASTQLAAMRASDLTPRLHELAGLSTLVVSAAHDPIAPPSIGRAIAQGIPGARYVEAADASHGLPITHPDWTNGLLVEHFAASTTAAPSEKA